MDRHLSPSRSVTWLYLAMGWGRGEAGRMNRLPVGRMSVRVAAQIALALGASLPQFLADLAREEGIPRRRRISRAEYEGNPGLKPGQRRTRRWRDKLGVSRKAKRKQKAAGGKPTITRCAICRSERHNRLTCPYREKLTPQMLLEKARAEAIANGGRG